MSGTPDAPLGGGQPAATERPHEVPLGIPTGFGPSGRVGKGAAPPVLRVRLTFTKEGALRYIGHLDVVRMWERAFRRAKLPLAYTLGFTPHPRLTLAAPLALGVTSEAELMDVYLREALTPETLAAQVGAQLPDGCRVVGATALPVEGPSVSSLTRWAAYTVLASGGGREEDPAQADQPMGSRWARASQPEPASETTPVPAPSAEGPWRPPEERLAPPEPDPPLPAPAEVDERIARFMAATTVPLERARDGKVVDVRPLVLGLQLGQPAPPGRLTLEMVVRLDSSGAGRPEDVAAALGLCARAAHRRRIGLESDPPI